MRSEMSGCCCDALVKPPRSSGAFRGARLVRARRHGVDTSFLQPLLGFVARVRANPQNWARFERHPRVPCLSHDSSKCPGCQTGSRSGPRLAVSNRREVRDFARDSPPATLVRRCGRLHDHPAGAPAPPRYERRTPSDCEVFGRHVGRGGDPGDASRPARETRGVRRRPTRKYFTTRCDGPGRLILRLTPPSPASPPTLADEPIVRAMLPPPRPRTSLVAPKPWRPRFSARRASHHDGGRHRRARDRGSRG